MQCSVCRGEGSLETLFQRTERPPFGRGRVYCPSCWETSLPTRIWVGVALSAATLGVVDAFTGAGALHLLAIAALLWPSTLLHELAHAAAGRSVGLRLARIQLGWGPLARRISLLGVPIHLHVIPLGGAAWLTGLRRPWLRLKRAWLVAAGPLANLAIAWIAFTAFAGSPVEALATDLALANLFLFGLSTWPNTARENGLDVRSDGSLLWDVLCSKRADLAAAERDEELADIGLVWEELWRRGDSAACERLARSALEQGHTAFASHLACSLLELDRTGEARELYRGFLDRPGDDPLAAALAKTAFAMTLDDACSAEDAALAICLSEEAFRQIGWHPTVRTTHGWLLVQTGRPLEGIELLESSQAQLRDPRERARLACTLAWAHAGLGRTADAAACDALPAPPKTTEISGSSEVAAA